MSNPEDLKFIDSGQDDVLFDKDDAQTHTFTNFPNSAADDEEEEDKSQLLKDDKKSPSFWTFEYYQQFFDVETHQVGRRVVGSMLPIPNRNYLKSQIRPSPDLYGPFWICTTLVFTTAIAGNLANYLSSAGKDYQWKYDFHKVTFAATAIFSYWWVIPASLYGVLWWRKSQAGYTFMEILCLYGYSLAIYIPISILWVINITWLKWLLVIVGAVMSGGVLMITIWPAVKEDTRQVAFFVIGLVFLFHLMLAAGFVLYFFHVPVASPTAQSAVTLKPPSEAPPVKIENITSKVHEDKPEADKNSEADAQLKALGDQNIPNKSSQIEPQNDKIEPKSSVVKKDVLQDDKIKTIVDEKDTKSDALNVGGKMEKLVKRDSKFLKAIGRQV